MWSLVCILLPRPFPSALDHCWAHSREGTEEAVSLVHALFPWLEAGGERGLMHGPADPAFKNSQSGHMECMCIHGGIQIGTTHVKTASYCKLSN